MLMFKDSIKRFFYQTYKKKEERYFLIIINDVI